MYARWKIKPCDVPAADHLSRFLNIPRPLAVLLAQRGCTGADEAQLFLNPALSTLRDPFELPGMDRAVARIRRALDDGERITVFGDYDADGVCSTALLVRVLRRLGGEVSAFIPSRMDEGYGLSPDALSACLDSHRPSLIVTVDCGTSSAESVEQARAVGTDVVVTDHHEPGGPVAPAVAVVNPKLDGGGAARVLAGAGVAFKLCHALVKEGRARGSADAAALDLRSYLDFVAVATLADLAPLRDENRALVRAGLQVLENSSHAGWTALKQVAGISGPVGTWHAGFALGPRINAAGRIGRADAALELFLTDLPDRAAGLARLLDEANRERQAIEKDMVREAVEELDGRFDERADFGIAVAREGWHAGVIGIVASRLVNRYNRPAAVIGLDGERGRGSCRSIEAFNILEGLGDCRDLLIRFGGHAMAAGFEIAQEHLAEFKLRFNEAAARRLAGADLDPALEIDCAVALAETDQALLEGLQRAGPFGQDHPEPVWAVHGVRAEGASILKDKHLRLTLTDGTIRREAIGFNLAAKWPDGPVDAAFTLQENIWNGRASIQLHLRDIRPARAESSAK